MILKCYILTGAKWGATELTYKIKHFTQGLTQNEVEAAIQHATEVSCQSSYLNSIINQKHSYE